MKTKTIGAVAGLVFGSYALVAQASGMSSLSVSPSGLTKAAGENFTASVVLAPEGNFIYAVEGTLTFTNASCRGISVASGVMVQSMPTCANPYFLVGIPHGTPSAKTILTVSLKGVNEGSASLGLASVDLIGTGVSLASEARGASYTITAPLVQATEPLTTTPGETVVSEPGESSEPISETPGEVTASSTSETASTTVPTENNLGAVVNRAITNVSAFSIVMVSVLLGLVVAGVVYYRRPKRSPAFDEIPTNLE